MADAVRCPDCEAPTTARFCPACGVRLSGRLTLRGLGGEFVTRFFGAESGLWYTIVQLTLHPGRTARAYLDGRRRRLLSPLAFYVLCAAIQMLGLWLLRDEVSKSVLAGLPEAYWQWLEEHGVRDPRKWAIDRYLAATQSAYSWLGVITFVLPVAGLTRLVIGRRAHFAELLATALYTIGFSMLITALTGQLLVRVSVTGHAMLSLAIYLVHAFFTFLGCHGRSWRTAGALALGMTVAITCFVYSIAVVTGIALTTGMPG